MRDLYHQIATTTSFEPAAKTASVTGTGVDLQGYESATVLIEVGTVTDGTHTPKLQDSPDNTNWTDVAAAAGSQIGTLAALASNTDQLVGYVNGQRYLRVFVTVAGATTGGVYGATIIKGHPRHQPAGVTQAP